MNIADHIHQKYNIRTDVIEIPNASREDMAELLFELNLKKAVEVGVAAGNFSATIMAGNPQLKMWGVDPYEPYTGYKDYVRRDTFSELERGAHERLDKYPGYEFIKKYSKEASEMFEDESLDFVYLDANHTYDFVTEDLELWTPKVKKGGIMAGDDYARIRARNGEPSSNWAVIPAIHDFTKKYGYQLYIWGMQAKHPGLKRDPIRSWMFIKP